MPSVATDAVLVTPRPELWRISDRSTFSALRRRGRRAQVSPITVTWLRPGPQDAVTPPRVGFAVGRNVGGDIVQFGMRDGRPIRWTFSEIRADSFLWQGHILEADGVSWHLQGEFRVRRSNAR